MNSSLFNFNLIHFFANISHKRRFSILLMSILFVGNIDILLGQCTSGLPLNPTSNTPVCEAGNALFFSAAGFASYQWTGPNGFTSSSQNPQITSASVAAAGTYSVVGTDGSGCTASATVSLAVNVNVKVPAEIGYSESNCGSYTVQPLQVVIPALGGTGTLETMWMESNVGNLLGMAAGGNSSSYSPGNINKTTYYRFCVRSEGCSEFKEGAIIKKEVLAAANVTASNTGAYCAGNNIQLNATSTDDNLVTDGSFTAEVAGKFIHAYSSVAGAGNFYHTDNASVWGLGACTDHTSGSGKMLIFDGYSVSGIKAWEYATPVLTNKTYTFSIWASSLSVANPASLKLTVNGVPINVAVTLPTTTCQWVQISATWNSGTNTSAEIAIVNETASDPGNDFAIDDIEFYTTGNFSWIGPNGFTSTAQNPTILASTLTNGGTYTVTYIKGNGCISVATTDVIVNDCPANCSNVVISTLPTICEADNLHLFASGGNTYNWAGPNGFSSTSQNPSILNATSANSGTYSVTITGDLGCTASTSATVTVNPRPNAPSVSDVSVCGYASANLSASGCATGTLSWYVAGNNEILVGTGANYTTPILFEAASFYVDCTENGCTSEQSTARVLLNDVITGISASPVVNYCQNQVYNFAAADAGPNATYLWDFGADAIPTTSTTQNVNNVYWTAIGTKTVTLTVTDNSTNCAKTVIELYDILTARASIGDYVWNDEDKDGIQDASEKGVANVNVTLLHNGEEVVAATTTDAYGKYTFDCLAAGSYQIKFSLPIDYGFTLKSMGSDPTLDSDVNPALGLTNIIALSAGENRTNVDAGVVYTTPTHTIIGDYVWLDANENGLQENNEVGVSGVTVSLFSNFNQLIITTLTDARGKYQFRDVPAGSYKIGVTLPLGLTFSLPNQGGNDEIDSDIDTATTKTAVFTLAAGQEKLTVDIGLIPQNSLKAYIGDYVWNDLDANGIQHVRETGVQGITVELWDDVGNLVRTTETDVFGQYMFTNLSQGFYVLRFTNLPVNWTLANRNQGSDDDLDSDARPSNGFTDTLQIYEGDRITNIDAGIYDISSTSTGRIGDYVWNDVNADGLQNSDEIGISGVNVTLYNFANIPIGTTTTSERGYYQFTGLSAGTYSVGFDNLPANYLFSPKNVGSDTNIDSDVNRASGRTDNIVLASNQTEISIDAGLQLNKNNGGYASVGNRVWNDANNNGLQDNGELGIANVSISLYTSSPSALIATTSSDANGNYLFTSLSAGSYYITFTSLPAGYTYTLSLQGTDNEIDSDAGITGATNPFELLEGENNLTIDAGLYHATTANNIGDYVWNDFNQNGLQDIGEKGLFGIGVKLYDNTNVLIAATVTDNNGKYQFTNIPDGSYYLMFTDIPAAYVFTSKGGGGAAATDSDVNPSTGVTDIFSISGASTNNDIDAGLFSTTRAVLGDYVWADDGNGKQDTGESGISGITVRLYDGIQLVSQTVTNESGLYQFTNLIAGSYTVNFSNLPQGATFTGKNLALPARDSDVNPSTGSTDVIALSAGQVNQTIDAGILLPTTTKGTLCGDAWTDTDGDGLQTGGEKYIGGVLAYLIDASSNNVSSTSTDAAGRYCFTNVEAGTYTVRFVNFPLGSVLTTPDAGDDNLDSDANTSTSVSTSTYTVIAGLKIEGPDAGVLPPSSVGGVAFEDNGTTPDGQRQTSEPKISGVVVTLYDINDTPLRSMRTDKNGAYLFTGLIADNYKVGFGSVSGRTFTGQDAGGNDNLDSDANILTGKTDLFALAVNQNKVNVDAGYLLQGVVFPVELRYFSAEWVNGDGLLKWGTTNEINISHFEVWRSLDEFSFERIIDNLPAKGNGINQNYKAFDYKVGAINADKVYYRLKMVDNDGKFAISKTIELILLRNSPLIYLNIYPNPAQNDIWFDYQLFDANQAEVTLINAAGQVAYKGVLKAEQNISQYRIDTRNLARGVYYLKLQTEDSSAIEKVILD